MATYLVIKNSNSLKSIKARDEEPNKPYLKVKSGYFPLTSKTSGSGIYAKASGSNYKVVQSYTTTSSTTSSSTTYGTYSESDSGVVSEYETNEEVIASVYSRINVTNTKNLTYRSTISASLPPEGSISITHQTYVSDSATARVSSRTKSFVWINENNNVSTTYSKSANIQKANVAAAAYTFHASFSVSELNYTKEISSSVTDETITAITVSSISVLQPEFSFNYNTKNGYNGATYNKTYQYSLSTPNTASYTVATYVTNMYSDATVTETYSVETTVTVD